MMSADDGETKLNVIPKRNYSPMYARVPRLHSALAQREHVASRRRHCVACRCRLDADDATSTSVDQHEVWIRVRGKVLPWILMTGCVGSRRRVGSSRYPLVPTANKAPDVFMRNKVFVAVRGKRTFWIVSPKNGIRVPAPFRTPDPC